MSAHEHTEPVASSAHNATERKLLEVKRIISRVLIDNDKAWPDNSTLKLIMRYADKLMRELTGEDS